MLMVDVSEHRGEDAVSELAAEGIDVRLEVGMVRASYSVKSSQ